MSGSQRTRMKRRGHANVSPHGHGMRTPSPRSSRSRPHSRSRARADRQGSRTRSPPQSPSSRALSLQRSPARTPRRESPPRSPSRVHFEQTPLQLAAGQPQEVLSASPEAALTNLARGLQEWYEQSERRACSFAMAKSALRASGVTSIHDLPQARDWLSRNIDTLEKRSGGQASSDSVGEYLESWFPGLLQAMRWLEPASNSDVKNFRFWVEDITGDGPIDVEDSTDMSDNDEEPDAVSSDESEFVDVAAVEDDVVSPKMAKAQGTVKVALQKYLTKNIMTRKYRVAHRCFIAWTHWARGEAARRLVGPRKQDKLKKWCKIRKARVMRAWRDWAKVRRGWKPKMQAALRKMANRDVARAFLQWNRWAVKRLDRRNRHVNLASKAMRRWRQGAQAAAFYRWEQYVIDRRRGFRAITTMRNRGEAVCFRHWKDYTLRKRRTQTENQIEREREEHELEAKRCARPSCYMLPACLHRSRSFCSHQAHGLLRACYLG